MAYCERKQYLPYFSAGIGGWLDEQICTSFKDILLLPITAALALAWRWKSFPHHALSMSS
eukprot:scaffold37718_cov187-Skeletonema_marinoi.AAC.2